MPMPQLSIKQLEPSCAPKAAWWAKICLSLSLAETRRLVGSSSPKVLALKRLYSSANPILALSLRRSQFVSGSSSKRDPMQKKRTSWTMSRIELTSCGQAKFTYDEMQGCSISVELLGLHRES